MKMKNEKILLGFIVIFFILSMSLLWAADADVIRKWEKRLQEASSPSEKVKCLGALVELNLQDAPQKAREYGNQALRIIHDYPDDKTKERLLLMICWASRYLGDYREALDLAREAEILARKIDDKRGVYLAFQSYVRIYSDLSDYRKAIDYALQARKISEELANKNDIANALDSIARIYQAKGDYKNALLYHRKFKETSDEILNTDINKRIAHLQVVYDVEKKEKENQLLKKNNQIQKMQLILLTLVSIFVLIIALVTHNRYRIKKKTEQVLRASEQKLKNMNAAKDRLFTIIAHDLGSPLNSLLLSAGHLKNHFRALEEHDIEEFIHNIYRQTRDMADLLENLLQWARVQIGKIEQNPEAVDMHLLTEETLLQVKYTAQNKHIRLASHIMENTIAWADKHMMKAVMRNLLSNAVKYSHPGGEIQITSTDAGNRIEITVSDFGVGMTEEKAERLFKEEIHESTRGTGNEKGTGLGLVLCKEFVEKNGGEIHVHSQLNNGSHFTFTLPKQG